jgi:CRISPR-associated protein Cmr5
MSVHTRSQKLAQAAYKQVAQRTMGDKYKSAAKKFPALIHTCGLAQAVAFGLAKSDHHEYLNDLAAVLGIASRDALGERSRRENLSGYLLLSRNAINAASWLKRYVEAAAPEETTGAES